MAEDEVRTFLESDDELKQPSDAYIADIFGYRGGTRETEDPKVLEAHSRVERTVNWLRAHGTPTEISLETLTDQWHDELDAAIPMPMLSPDAQTIYERHRLNRIGSDTWTLEGDKAFWGEIEHLVAEKHPLWDEFALALDVEGKRAAQIQRWAWEREHLLPWGWILFNATKPPPDWLLGSLGVGNGTADAPVVTLRPTRLLRPIVSPAFRHDGREGLGRISSSQISQGIFAACIASKEAWGKTSKGFPRYTHSVQSGEIEITLRPEVESKDEKKLAAQIGEMESIRDELSISDWDMACILMEQAIAENGGHGTAYISDAAACDYRKLEKNRKEGFAAGHHPDNRKRASDAINRLVHLWIRTDTLQVRQVDEKGKLGSVTVNWREKFITIRQTLDRQDTEATIGWRYEFGRSFTTFLQAPNRFVAYLLQGTIALKSTQGSAKRVAHYIALRLKVDAKNGAEYDITMGKLVEAAHLPYDEARIQRTIDQNEDTLRTCIREGLFRIKTQDGDILYSGSQPAMLAAWTLQDPNLKGKKLLMHWKGQKLLILAEPDIERRYDKHRGIGRTGKSAIHG